jgi:hypothetical protein
MIMILVMLLQQMEIEKGNMLTKNDEYESVTKKNNWMYKLKERENFGGHMEWLCWLPPNWLR